ncbi:sulfite exporter TauE/SafE family protein [Alteribacillus iranensis]|uniref:sulfite exporter TauE/SafE family protein n=1 Tax=Alteribacillus iranensis TaxID=930128 RepID=UPI000B89CE18|nr:sulfite exporter TauE/SafE family protein [Alteribacillus iranensis]
MPTGNPLLGGESFNIAGGMILEILLLLTGALLTGVIKGSVGLGSGILPVTVLSIFLPPDQVVVLLYPVMLTTTLFSLVPNWKKWNTTMLKILLPSSILGSWLGVLLLVAITNNVLRITVGALALLFVINEYFKTRKSNSENEKSKKKGWVFYAVAIIIGFCGGVMSSLIHSGGLIFSMFLLRLNLSNKSFVATLVALMAVNDLVKGLFYGQAQLIDLSSIALLIGIVILGIIGVAGGNWIQKFISVKHFRLIILTVLTISGSSLFFSGMSF